MAPANRLVSGKTRTTSGQPLFLDPAGSAATVTIEGLVTNLIVNINGTLVTISTDIAETGLTVAPGSNNTCAINDTRFADQADSKYFGEIDSQFETITIDTVGSEISSRVGQMIALKTASSEIMWGWLKSTTEFTSVKRGYFFDSAGAPIVRETIANNDTLTLLEAGWIFVENDGTTVDTTYLTPVYSFTSPSAPATGQYWYDLTNQTWKRYTGAEFAIINRILVGVCVIDTTNCIGARAFDFFQDFKTDNTIDVEVFSDTVVRSESVDNCVSVYGTKIQLPYSVIDWDNTADMETGSVAGDTTYYLYISSDGERFISTERPYDRWGDLRGRYHPYNNWRYIAKAKTDGAADWFGVVGSSMFDRLPKKAKFESEDLIIDDTGNDSARIAFSKLTLTNAEGATKILDAHDLTVTFSDYIQGSELSNTNYEWWIDSRGKMAFLPRLTGTATGTSAGFLVDSGNTFPDYSVFRGATVYNTTDLTKTTVSVSPTASGSNLALTSDIMASGENYDIKLKDPVGLDSFACHVGTVFNNGSGHLDNSFYAQIQEGRRYNGDGTSFATTVVNATLSSLTGSIVTIYQTLDIHGIGYWHAKGDLALLLSGADANFQINLSGFFFKTTYHQPQSGFDYTNDESFSPYAISGSTTIGVITTTVTSNIAVTYDAELGRKPTFHT